MSVGGSLHATEFIYEWIHFIFNVLSAKFLITCRVLCLYFFNLIHSFIYLFIYLFLGQIWQITNANICPNPCLAICAHSLTFAPVPLGFKHYSPPPQNKQKKIIIFIFFFARYEEINLAGHLFKVWQVTCREYGYTFQLFCSWTVKGLVFFVCFI